MILDRHWRISRSTAIRTTRRRPGDLCALQTRPYKTEFEMGREALSRMLLHPVGEQRRAYQVGLHRDVSEFRVRDDLLSATSRRGETAEHGDDLDHDRRSSSLQRALPLTA
jgi:hypothetical protein